MNNKMTMKQFRKTPRYQQGVVLAAVLMIVLVVTILGVTAINTASLEGKLAQNFSERTHAFQAAEIALRAGEQVLEGLTAEPTICSTHPCSCTDSVNCNVWSRNSLQAESLVHSGSIRSWWEFQNDSWWNDMGATTVPANSRSTAMYIIEERSFVQNNTQANVVGSGLNYYTVTALGIRKGTGAQVVLQSHFMKRFN